MLCFLSSYESLSAHHIQPRCVDSDPEFQRCDSGQLIFNDALSFYTDDVHLVNITQYEQVYGRYTANRPIYKALVPDSSSVNVYLYHAEGTWRLGVDYSTSTFVRVSDTALRPEFITGVWQLHYNGRWRTSSNLRIRCRGMCYLQC